MLTSTLLRALRHRWHCVRALSDVPGRSLAQKHPINMDVAREILDDGTMYMLAAVAARFKLLNRPLDDIPWVFVATSYLGT